MNRPASDPAVSNIRFGCLWAITLVVAWLFGLVWWVFVGSTTPPVRFNCRLTLYIATPKGERVGSGVLEIDREYTSLADQALGYAGGTETRGEAVTVDLGAYGLVFVVLANDPDRYQSRDPTYSLVRPYDPFDRMVTTVFPEDRFHGSWPVGRTPQNLDEAKAQWKAYAAVLKSVKPESEVPLDELPMIVRFREIGDPATIQRVNPDDFAATVGAGVTLQRATLAITADPVTRGIYKTLPWLARGGPSASFRPPYNHEKPEQGLTNYDFREDY